MVKWYSELLTRSLLEETLPLRLREMVRSCAITWPLPIPRGMQIGVCNMRTLLKSKAVFNLKNRLYIFDFDRLKAFRYRTAAAVNPKQLATTDSSVIDIVAEFEVVGTFVKFGF